MHCDVNSPQVVFLPTPRSARKAEQELASGIHPFGYCIDMILETQGSVQNDSQKFRAFLIRSIAELHLFTEQLDVGAPLGLMGICGEKEGAAFLQVQV